MELYIKRTFYDLLFFIYRGYRNPDRHKKNHTFISKHDNKKISCEFNTYLCINNLVPGRVIDFSDPYIRNVLESCHV